MVRKINFPKRTDLENMEIVTINVPKKHLAIIEKLVNQRVYPSRSEAIRVAIRQWLFTEMDLYTKFVEPILEAEDINTIRIPNGDGTYQKLFRMGEA